MKSVFADLILVHMASFCCVQWFFFFLFSSLSLSLSLFCDNVQSIVYNAVCVSSVEYVVRIFRIAIAVPNCPDMFFTSRMKFSACISCVL
jgi:hypothetical protein